MRGLLGLSAAVGLNGVLVTAWLRAFGVVSSLCHCVANWLIVMRDGNCCWFCCVIVCNIVVMNWFVIWAWGLNS